MIEPIDTHDFPNRHPDDLRNVIEKAAIALADQAGGAAAALADEPVDTYPYDIASLDMAERLRDAKPRFVGLKAAIAIIPRSRDTVKRMIKKRGIGFKFGGVWYLDRTLLHRVVT